jgi:hypothetical protein
VASVHETRISSLERLSYVCFIFRG